MVMTSLGRALHATVTDTVAVHCWAAWMHAVYGLRMTSDEDIDK